MMNLRRFKALAALPIAALLASCGTSGSADSGGQFEIGVMTDLSGPFSSFSTVWAAGMRSAVHQVNEGGGIHGKEISLLERDNAGELQQATANFRELSGTDVLTIDGNAVSNIIAAVSPQAESAGIPMTNATDLPELMEPDPPEMVFSTEIPTPMWAELQMEYAAELMEERGVDQPRVAVYTIETAAADDYRTAAADLAEERGWEVVASESAEQTATDTTPQGRAIAEADPDIVITYVINLAQGVRSMQAAGLDPEVPVLSQKQSGGLDVFEAMDELGQEFYAMRSYAVPYETDIPAVADMRTAFEESGNWSDEYLGHEWATQGYVHGLMVAAALETCGEDCTRETYGEAMSGLSLDTGGLTGDFVDDGDHRLVKSAQVYTLEDGQEEPVRGADDWISVEGSQ